MHHPPHVLHLIGPIWPNREQAQAAARIVSAANGGMSIAYCIVPNAPPGWGGYSLAKSEGCAIAGWETAAVATAEDQALVATDPMPTVTAVPDEVTAKPTRLDQEAIPHPFVPADDPASSIAPGARSVASGQVGAWVNGEPADVVEMTWPSGAVPGDLLVGIIMPSPEAAPTGDPRFRALLDELWNLHCRKGADYGADADPLANVRAGTDWGVPNWVATMVRATDKLRRLQTFARRGTLQNEGARDSLVDLAAYCLLAVLLLDEDRATGEGETDG